LHLSFGMPETLKVDKDLEMADALNRATHRPINTIELFAVDGVKKFTKRLYA
jgi:hypothetical protein